MGLAIVVFLALEIDNILVGKLLGLTVLGYYVLAFTLANLPATHLSKVISRVLFPTYSELQNDLPALQRAFLAVYKVIAILIIPIAMVFVVFAPEVITILYGDKWVAAADALRILAVFGCLRAFSALAGYLFNAVGRPSLTFYLNLVRLVLLLIILIPLTQTFGLVGASVAVTLPMAIQFAVENRVIGTTLRVGGVRILKTMAAPVAWSMVMCVVFALLKIAVYIVDDNRVDLVVSDAFGVVLSYGGGGSTLGVFETLFIVTVGMLVYLALSFNAIATQVKRIRAAAARK
jgi:O-antigen/teichoic acid export membrane protein